MKNKVFHFCLDFSEDEYQRKAVRVGKRNVEWETTCHYWKEGGLISVKAILWNQETNICQVIGVYKEESYEFGIWTSVQNKLVSAIVLIDGSPLQHRLLLF